MMSAKGCCSFKVGVTQAGGLLPYPVILARRAEAASTWQTSSRSTTPRKMKQSRSIQPPRPAHAWWKQEGTESKSLQPAASHFCPGGGEIPPQVPVTDPVQAAREIRGAFGWFWTQGFLLVLSLFPIGCYLGRRMSFCNCRGLLAVLLFSLCSPPIHSHLWRAPSWGEGLSATFFSLCSKSVRFRSVLASVYHFYFSPVDPFFTKLLFS